MKGSHFLAHFVEVHTYRAIYEEIISTSARCHRCCWRVTAASHVAITWRRAISHTHTHTHQTYIFTARRSLDRCNAVSLEP